MPWFCSLDSSLQRSVEVLSEYHQLPLVVFRSCQRHHTIGRTLSIHPLPWVVFDFCSKAHRRLVCTEGDAEPHIQVAARRRAGEAKGGAANLRNALSPTAATHNPNSVPFITHGIFGTQVPVGSQPVLTPLPDVAVHVVEAKPVRQELTDWCREHIAVFRDGGLPVRKLLFRRSVGNVSHLDQALF